MKNYNPAIILVITAISLLLFLPYLGVVHLFDWDEINFAEAAREMLVTGNWTTVTINYEPFWEKPPLFIWMQAVSMKVFGVNEFAARFPTVLSAIATLNLIYYIAMKHFRAGVAQWWVLAYLASLAPHFYFKTGLIDPTFNLFIFISIYHLAVAYNLFQQQINNSANLLWASFFIGIAVLVKGPVAILIFILVLVVMCIVNRKLFFSISTALVGTFITIGVVSIWFLPETIKNGPWFIQKFIIYQAELFSQNVAGHQQPFYYHPLVLFFGCFPASIFAIKAMSLAVERHREKPFFNTFHILFWVVLILFSLVKTKIIHYSSLCWLPLTFMAAYWIDNAIDTNKKIGKFSGFLLLLSAIPILVLELGLSYIAYNNKWDILTQFSKDEFANKLIVQFVDKSQWQWILLFVMGLTLLLLIIRGLRSVKHLIGVFIFSVINLFFISVIVMPVVDSKLQKPLFDFYKTLAGKDVYIETMHFKSYAHYFYAKAQPLDSKSELAQLNQQFLKGKSIQDLSSDSFMKLKEVQAGFYRDAKRDKPIYLIYKTDYPKLPKAEDGIYFIGNYGAYKVYKRPKKGS